MLIKSIYILTLIAVSHCELKLPKNCADVPVIKNFNGAKYSGDWYVIYNSDEKIGKYVMNKIRETNNTHFNLIDESIENGLVKMHHNILMKVKESGEENDGKLVVQCHENNSLSNYWILDTDYHSYSLVLLCRSNGDSSEVSASILSKEPFLKAVDTLSIDKYFKNHMNKTTVLDWKNLKPVVQYGLPRNGGMAIHSTCISLITLCLIISRIFS